MQIRCYPEAEVPLELRQQMVALQRQAWPSFERADIRPWHDPLLNPLSMLLAHRGRIVSALDILSKVIEHRGISYEVSGISAAVTHVRFRRMGFGRKIVAAARAEMSKRGADLSIFTCDSPLRRFYESGGWTYLPGTVLIGGTPESPFPSDHFDKVTMAAFLSSKARAHAESFIGARVELYSGDIDKLW